MSDFETFDDYTEALAEYKFNQKAQAQAQQYNQQAQAQKVAQEWQSKVEKVRAVAPDFDEAFANVAEITFAQSTLDAVAGHEKGAEIVLYKSFIVCERIKADKDAKREERELMLDDQRFAAGDQWPMQIKRKREIEGRRRIVFSVSPRPLIQAVWASISLSILSRI